MFSIFKNFFGSSRNLRNISSNFKSLKKTSNVVKIFECIENYSSKAEIRYVGGCVRKILNKEIVDDIDLATNLKPDQVISVLKKNNIPFYETGIKFGTITAYINDEKYEITSLRKDISTDGRYATVEFTDEWQKDAERRDFTINTIYSDLDGNLFDPFNGVEHLKEGKIVFVGETDKRIKEDYLRILRYLRFFSKYSKIKHDQNIIKNINKNLFGISKISSERLLDEFKKIFLGCTLENICKDEFSLETIKLIFPQFVGLYNFKYLDNSSFRKLNELDFTFLLSLLILDETDNSEYFFYKFNISKKAQKRILNIKNFYFYKNEKNKINSKSLWKLFYKHGKDTLNDILNYKIFTTKKKDKKLNEYIQFFKDKEIPIFPIKGEDLMKKFNLPEGKKVGENLKLIEKIWIDNEFQISEDDIKKIVNN